MRVLFTGGGTGGHLYPLIAVAQNLLALVPGAKIEFIGSKGKIEEKAVPAAGFVFHGIKASSFPKKAIAELVKFPFVFIKSLLSALKYVKSLKPEVAVGSGAYISAPGILAAKITGAKIILLEQNSFPGVTTKLLQGLAREIHVSFSDSVKFFKDKDKVFLTGNPVRPGMKGADKSEAIKSFGLDPQKPVVLVLGGSLGAGKINDSIAGILPGLKEKGIQVLWQTGERYYASYSSLNSTVCKVVPYLNDMASAYAAADLMVARAGATTIAEIAAIAMGTILIPSPNVANNHQYYNALSLSEKNAAVLIEEKEIESRLFPEITALLSEPQKLNTLKENISKFSAPEAGTIIANRIIELAGGRE